MSSIILLDQKFKPNNVDILVFESFVLLAPSAVWEIDDMVQILCTGMIKIYKNQKWKTTK